MSRYAAKARPGSRVEEWSPTQFSPMRYSPALWLDAGDAGTFTYSSGTVVSQWDDKSGNGRHVSQATAAAQPSRSGSRNGIPTVVFDGGDVLSYSGSTGVNVGTATVFVIWAESSTVNFSGLLSCHAGTGNDQDRENSLVIDAGNSGTPTAGVASRFFSTVGSMAFTATRPVALNLFSATFFDGGNICVERNGVPGTNGSPRSGTFTTAGGGFLVGGRYQSGAISASFRLNGDIAEIIVYPSVLTYLERRQVTEYLNNKWRVF